MLSALINCLDMIWWYTVFPFRQKANEPSHAFKQRPEIRRKIKFKNIQWDTSKFRCSNSVNYKQQQLLLSIFKEGIVLAISQASTFIDLEELLISFLEMLDTLESSILVFSAICSSVAVI